MPPQFLNAVSNDTYIQAWAAIKSDQVWKNGQLIFSGSTPVEGDFFLEIYRHFDLKYPKFHKMDPLSKLGFLTAEILLGTESGLQPNEETAIVLANRSASLDTDYKYFDTTQGADAFPSPALFVYTLPNIVVGEIAIRHKFKGENTFFVSNKFEYRFIADYVNLLLETGRGKACITGWVELFENGYESLLFLAGKEPNPVAQNLNFTPENIKKVFENGCID